MSLAPGQIALPPPPSPIGLVEVAPRPARGGTVQLLRGPGWDIPPRTWRGLWSQRLFRDSADVPETEVKTGVEVGEAWYDSGYIPPDIGPDDPPDNVVPTAHPSGVIAPPVRIRRDVPQKGPSTRKPVLPLVGELLTGNRPDLGAFPAADPRRPVVEPPDDDPPDHPKWTLSDAVQFFAEVHAMEPIDIYAFWARPDISPAQFNAWAETRWLPPFRAKFQADSDRLWAELYALAQGDWEAANPGYIPE